MILSHSVAYINQRIFLFIVLLMLSYQSNAQEFEAITDSIYERGGEMVNSAAYDKALYELLLSCRLSEIKHDHYRLARGFNAIGLVYDTLNELDMSRSYYSKALMQLDQAPDKELFSFVTNNLGMLFEDQNQLDSALFFYQKSLDMKRSLADSSAISTSLNNIAGIHMKESNYPLALDYYLYSVAAKRSADDSIGLFHIYANIANVYGYLGEIDSIKYFLDKGMELKTPNSKLMVISNYYNHYSRYYRVIGDYEKSFFYQDSVIRLQSDMFRDKIASELSKYEMEYEVDIKNEKIKKERIKNDLLVEKQKREQSEKYVLVLLIIGLVIFVSAFYIILRFKLNNAEQRQLLLENEKSLNDLKIIRSEEQKELLKDKIEIKSKELISYSNLSLQKQAIINELKTRLDSLKSTHKNLPDDLILDLKRTLKTGVNMDEEWDRFKVHFEQINDLFFTHLKNNHPILSQIDHRHCAYIKIGLSTKEIATLFNITPASVQKSRVRLKKKMELNSGQDLYEYIQQNFY